MNEHTNERAAQAAWLVYRNDYIRLHYLTGRQTASRMRRRDFIAGYLAALATLSGEVSR